MQLKKLLLLAVHLSGCFASDITAACNTGSDSACTSANYRDDVSLLMKDRPQIISRDKPALVEDGNSAFTIGDNEFIIQPLETLPAVMGNCGTWMVAGGCTQWNEITVCGKTEDEIYESLESEYGKGDSMLDNRVIIGDRSKNSPSKMKTLTPTGQKCNNKCTDPNSKWKAKTWTWKCRKPKCKDCMQCDGIMVPDKSTSGKASYTSAQPVACASGSAVPLLVNHLGNLGDKATAKALKALEKIGVKQPFSCATENWFRTRMSEMLETDPSPYLLSSFPDVQESIEKGTDGLLQEAMQVAKHFSQDSDEDDDEDDHDDGHYTTDGQRHVGKSEALLEQEELALSLSKIRARINATIGNIIETSLRLRKKFGHDHGIAMGPRFIRMTFHDAADYRNLISGAGKISVCHKDFECGGVDFRLHTNLLSVGLNQHSLSQTDETDPDALYTEEDPDMDNSGESPIGDPNHNRGLTNAIQWVRAWGKEQTILSKADIMVLGAHVAVETWLDGPEMTYHAGRVDADHSSSKILESEYCTHEDCQGQNTLFLAAPVAEPVADGMFCPATSTLSGLQDVLNLTTKEVVALQGSHSVGGIIRCSGMGNTGQGPFCGGVKCCPPGMKEENGQCVCREDDCRSLLLGMNGASFDGTPNKLDNMYYKQLNASKFEEIPECDLVAPEMPKMGSGDQALFICMKKKGFKYKASEGNSTWEDVVKAGCSGVIKNAYKGAKESTCRAIWKEGGAGLTYPKRDWCSVDECMDNCNKQPEICGEKPIQEISVLMGKFQNKNYGKICFAVVQTSSVSEVQAVIDGIIVDKYGETLVEDDFNMTDVDGVTFSPKGMMLFKGGAYDGKSKKPKGGKVTMKSVLQRELDQASKSGDVLDPPFSLTFSDPDDPKCNQCTVEACANDALDALENALGMIKPDSYTSISDWVKDVLEDCKKCKTQCLTDDAQQQGEASNKAPEWCLSRTGESFCARGGHVHECPGEHKYGIPNHADGRRTLIWNTLRWSRFRGQTRRVAMLPADWAQLRNQTHRDAIKDFAGDNDGFKRVWAEVFQKVSEAGMQQGAAQQCATTTCKFDGSAIVCANALNPGMGMQTLRFDNCSGGFQGISNGTTCTFLRNFAVSGVFTCGSSTTELYCSTQRGRNTYEVAKKELDSGGDHDTCFKDMTETKGVMLATDTLAFK